MSLKIASDFLRHGSNAALIGGVIVIVSWALWGNLQLPVLWILIGALLFYANEYLWHRFAFHAAPSSRPWLRRLQHRLHYDHHSEPNRLDLLFLPIWFVVLNLTLSAALFYLAFGLVSLAPLLLGVMLAMLHYEWTHYVAHILYQPITPWGRFMKRYHLRHHFISEKYWYGVSHPFFDFLYGTWPSPKNVEKSATVRLLWPDEKMTDAV